MVSKEIAVEGKSFSFETGRFAKQADGAVMVKYADTMVLATVVSEREPKEGSDFFPLQVEYREKSCRPASSTGLSGLCSLRTIEMKLKSL
jgi:polyribonucleotide nucleotidyltransferase